MKELQTITYKKSQNISPEETIVPQVTETPEIIPTEKPEVSRPIIKTHMNRGKGNTYWLALYGVIPQSPLGQMLVRSEYRLFRKNFTKLVTQENLNEVENELNKLETDFNITIDRTGFENIRKNLAAQEQAVTEVSEGAERIEQVLDSALPDTKKKELTDKFLRNELEKLANLTDETAKQEIIQKFLIISKDFHKYSFINYLLMMIQNANVSRFVRGAKQWEGDKFKRKVREGEQPMDIFAPNLSRYIHLNKLNDIVSLLSRENINTSIKDNFEEILKRNGLNKFPYRDYLYSLLYRERVDTVGDAIRKITEQINSPMAKKYKRVYYETTPQPGQGVNFKMVKVYDVSQTDPMGPDSFDPDKVQWQSSHNVHDENIFKFVKAALDFSKVAEYVRGKEKKRGIEIDLEAATGGAGGWSIGSQIAINKMSKGARQFSTVIHELAHSILHFGFDRENITSGQREIEAESTAFIVLNYFGHNEPQFAANYLALKQVTSQDVLSRYSKIEFAARKIIHGIENFLFKEANSWYKKLKTASNLILFVEEFS